MEGLKTQKEMKRDEGTERGGRKELHRLGRLCGTSTGNSSVISRLPDLGVVQHETQIRRTLPIRNYMLCRQGGGGISHYSLFT